LYNIDIIQLIHNSYLILLPVGLQDLGKIPFVTILKNGEEPFSMFKDLTMFDWVLKPVITYSTRQELIDGLELVVIKPAIQKHKELIARKTEELKIRSIEEIMQDIKSKSESI